MSIDASRRVLPRYPIRRRSDSLRGLPGPKKKILRAPEGNAKRSYGPISSIDPSKCAYSRALSFKIKFESLALSVRELFENVAFRTRDFEIFAKFRNSANKKKSFQFISTKGTSVDACRPGLSSDTRFTKLDPFFRELFENVAFRTRDFEIFATFRKTSSARKTRTERVTGSNLRRRVGPVERNPKIRDSGSWPRIRARYEVGPENAPGPPDRERASRDAREIYLG
ncbi:hypothetical protein TNCT_354761 [Trichonephila clavata]|uniref:Uncharacterized protein n=1 Tax=Trichonephila clavata TaxID=2740835 RepID=A0A8X6L604_TRICU|nr:hypothetical protein TNCT_354761 [Trichonephila clavata]